MGTLGNLITTISTTGNGADIGFIKTYAMGEFFNIRDISIMVDDEKHLDQIIKRVQKLPNIELLQIIDEVLDVHQGGKIKTMPTFPVTSEEDLRKVYTPGVAQVCEMISKDPKAAQNYTGVQRTVALVTNGSRVLGLGDIGPLASLPVMEGKAALFSQLTGLNMIPVLVDTQDPREFIDTVVRISKGFGAIQMEDIKTPECFEIEAGLKKRLPLPVMHDDQHGTAVVALAAAIQACRISGKDINKLEIGQIGLGASGQAIAKLVSTYIGRPVWGADRSEEAKKRFEEAGGKLSQLKTIMESCDLVILTTGKRDLITKDMVKKGQILMALSNPYPEIPVQEALAAGAKFAADGTRVNNLLGYPGIFKGALEVRAKEINQKMLLAAAQAIADSAPENEMVPHPLQKKLHEKVALAVAKAAFESGVAGMKPEVYYHRSAEHEIHVV